MGKKSLVFLSDFLYNRNMILGIDEVGRGAWAGPLVVGACILNNAQIDGLTDSKALTKKQREKIVSEIRESPAIVGLGWVSNEELDKIGLSDSLKLATKKPLKKYKLNARIAVLVLMKLLLMELLIFYLILHLKNIHQRLKRLTY